MEIVLKVLGIIVGIVCTFGYVYVVRDVVTDTVDEEE